jgi:hypothetical protein
MQIKDLTVEQLQYLIKQDASMMLISDDPGQSVTHSEIMKRNLPPL